MDIIEPGNRSEKWVLYVGRQCSGKYWPLGFILLAAICVSLVLLKIISYLTISYLMLSIMWLFAAFLCFERRNFYQIIVRQSKYIADLERKIKNAE